MYIKNIVEFPFLHGLRPRTVGAGLIILGMAVQAGHLLMRMSGFNHFQTALLRWDNKGHTAAV